LLSTENLPAFAAIQPQHVEPAMRELLGRHSAAIARIEMQGDRGFASVIEPLEQLQHELARTWSPVSHLNAVCNSSELRKSYNACLPLITEHQSRIGQSEALYEAYRSIEERESAQLDDTRRRVVANALRDFRLAGVALDGARKQRFKAIMIELAQLGARFDENVLDCTNAWRHLVSDAVLLRGLNEGIIEQAQRRAREADARGWLLALDQPTYLAVITDAESGELRRTFYEAWNTRASDQGPHAGRWNNATVISEILRLRHEAARLLEFASYAEYALATRMARTPEEVTGFLREFAHAARPAAEREFAELSRYAGVELEAWDVTFWTERLQRERFSVSQEELRPYFPLPRVLSGLFEVAERLFAIRIRERGGVPTWHADTRYFDIEDAAGKAVGGFYLDPYARPHKRSGAWMDECIGRMDLGARRSLPVAYLVCNFLPPAGDAPALLTHDDVVTLFHEFGHGLHHLLTRVGYPSIAGINGVAWDAVELPSQFMENYAWHEAVLDRISGHFRSGVQLPEHTRRQLIATRNFHAGLAALRQVEFALFDFRIHAEYRPDAPDRVMETLREVRSEVAIVRAPDWTRFPHSFGHIFAGGYAAGYYSYKWAEVLAADAFAAFEETHPFDRATAQRFLDSILSRGGSRDALDAFIEFRGRRPQIAPLLRQHGMLVE
jgi:oligopeptidase A